MIYTMVFKFWEQVLNGTILGLGFAHKYPGIPDKLYRLISIATTGTYQIPSSLEDMNLIGRCVFWCLWKSLLLWSLWPRRRRLRLLQNLVLC